MRKVNQILMATVAILLTLVLISTSVVSSVFARFTITKSAETTVTLQQFGVKIELTPKEGSLVKSTSTPDVKKGDSVSMQFTSSLVMDETLYDALNVKITGTPSVDVKLRMTCKVVYDETKYTVPEYTDANGKKIAGGKYMPLGFSICFPDSNGEIDFDPDVNYVCRPYQPKASDDIEEIIMRNTANKLFGGNYTKTTFKDFKDSNGNWYYEVSYLDIEDEIKNKVSDFYIGFDWLATGTYGGENYPTETESLNNKIATYISENAYNSSIKITYTFTIVQAN